MGLSNYPPGVSGNEPEIQGEPEDDRFWPIAEQAIKAAESIDCNELQLAAGLRQVARALEERAEEAEDVVASAHAPRCDGLLCSEVLREQFFGGTCADCRGEFCDRCWPGHRKECPEREESRR